MGGLTVGDSGKPPQPIFVDIHPQRVTRRHQHIHSEVKLEPVDEKWLEGAASSLAELKLRLTYSRDVLLHNTMFSWSDGLGMRTRVCVMAQSDLTFGFLKMMMPLP